MIEVKGTKTGAKTGAEAGTPADLYATPPQTRGRGHRIVGMIIASLVVYLKAFFGEEAAAAPETPEAPPAEDAPDAPQGGSAPLPAPAEADAGAGETPEQTRLDLGFEAGTDTITFFPPPRDGGFPVARPVGFVRAQANDNSAPQGAVPTAAPRFGAVAPRPVPVAPAAETPDDGNDPDASEPDEKDGPDASRNRAPVVSGPVLLCDLQVSALLSLAVPELLRNASDPDGDALELHNLSASSGTLTRSGEGWVFTAGCAPGEVVLSYDVSDGQAAVAQTARFQVIANRIEGGAADDLLVGTTCADRIEGFGGDDNIDGRGGNDTLAGGAGADHLVGGAGDDLLDGGAGADVLIGGAGDDRLFGGAGDDRLSGGAGSDALQGGEGADTVLGGAGNDSVLGDLDGAADRYDGGAGQDLLDYSAALAPLEIDLRRGLAEGAEIGRDSFSGFERILAGAGDDLFTFGGTSAALSGGAGRDLYRMAAGDSVQHSPFVVEILDFEVGDLLRMGAAEIFVAPQDPPDGEDRFDRLFGADDAGTRGPLRYRNDWSEEECRTVVEADFDGDGTFEAGVWIAGQHSLLVQDCA